MENETKGVKLGDIADTHLDSSEAEWLSRAGTHLFALEATYLHLLKDPKATYKARKAIAAWEDMVRLVYPTHEAITFVATCRAQGIKGAKSLQDLHKQEEGQAQE